MSRSQILISMILGFLLSLIDLESKPNVESQINEAIEMNSIRKKHNLEEINLLNIDSVCGKGNTVELYMKHPKYLEIILFFDRSSNKLVAQTEYINCEEGYLKRYFGFVENEMKVTLIYKGNQIDLKGGYKIPFEMLKVGKVNSWKNMTDSNKEFLENLNPVKKKYWYDLVDSLDAEINYSKYLKSSEYRKLISNNTTSWGDSKEHDKNYNAAKNDSNLCKIIKKKFFKPNSI